MLIGWEAYNYFINCTEVSSTINVGQNKQNGKMAESHLNQWTLRDLNTKEIAPEELKQKD